MPTKRQLIESAIEKIVRRTIVSEGLGYIDKRRYSQARKGIEIIANALFDLQNIAVDDPDKDGKKAKNDEVRKHLVAIREILDDIV